MSAFLKHSTLIVSVPVIVLMLSNAASTTESPWPSFGVIALYAIALIVLFRSEAKQFKPGYWIAFALAFAPILFVFIVFFLYTRAGGC